jgi:hypothetical protein
MLGAVSEFEQEYKQKRKRVKSRSGGKRSKVGFFMVGSIEYKLKRLEVHTLY